ncbi:MAG: Ig-like domain-containing protein [Oscillospiraceae bacterium]|jgi:uncharacterized protein YjdB|nr:Ig-like domain-containing protein [Oscillospiraceae bacterium]
MQKMKRVFSALLAVVMLLSVFAVTSFAAPAPAVKKVVLASTLSLAVGQTNTPKATVTPKGAKAAFTWSSSNKAVAKIDAKTGKITPLKVGTTFITVKAGDKVSNKLKLTVKAKPAPTKITLKAAASTVIAGNTTTIKPTFTPAYADTGLTYTSSNDKVAKVDKNTGKVTAVKGKTGTVTITATSKKSGKIKGTVKITVKLANPTKIVLKAGANTLEGGKKTTVTATFTPADANKTLTWTSDKKNVATVDASGNVTAIKGAGGTATITAKSKVNAKITASVKITVKPVPTSITLKTASITIGQWEPFTIGGVTVQPAAATKTLSFNSLNKNFVEVDANGKLNAKAVGTATIEVKTWNGLVAKLTVKVIPAPLGINYKTSDGKTALTLSAGQVVTPWVTYTNTGDVRKGVTFSSSDPSVATVDINSGKITAVYNPALNAASIASKKATIKATTWNNRTAEIVVTVVPNPVGITTGIAAKTLFTTMNADGSAKNVSYNYTYTVREEQKILGIVVRPKETKTVTIVWDANLYGTTYTSSDKSVATIDAVTGQIKAIKAGTTTITYTYWNGLSKSYLLTVNPIEVINDYNAATALFYKDKPDYLEQNSLYINTVTFSDTFKTIFGLMEGVNAVPRGTLNEMKVALEEADAVGELKAVPDRTEWEYVWGTKSKWTDGDSSLLLASLKPAHVTSYTRSTTSGLTTTRLNVNSESNPKGLDTAVGNFTANMFSAEEFAKMFNLDEMLGDDPTMQKLAEVLLSGIDIQTYDVRVDYTTNANGQLTAVHHNVGAVIKVSLEKKLLREALAGMGVPELLSNVVLSGNGYIDIMTFDIQVVADFSGFQW